MAAKVQSSEDNMSKVEEYEVKVRRTTYATVKIEAVDARLASDLVMEDVETLPSEQWNSKDIDYGLVSVSKVKKG